MENNIYIKIYPLGAVVNNVNYPPLWEGNGVLSNLSVTYAVSKVPSLQLTLPLECNEFIVDTHAEVHITIGDCVQFIGIANAGSVDYSGGVIQLQLDHIIGEFKYDHLPFNLAIKQIPISTLYYSYNFGKPGWTYTYDAQAQNSFIEYLFSNEDKLSAIGDIIRQTLNVEWRITLAQGGRHLEFFDPISSTKEAYVLDERKIINLTKEIKYSDIVNQLKVTAGNIGNGTGQMTLREYFLTPAIALPNFPVNVALTTPNTDEIFNPLDVDIKTGSNDEFEYEINDIQSQINEQGRIYQGRLNLNDLYPIPDQGQFINDNDRLTMYITVYSAAIRYLRTKRRNKLWTVEYSELPCDLNVGDKVRLSFDRKNVAIKSCDGQSQIDCIESYDEELFVIERTVNWDINGLETNVLLLGERMTEYRSIQKSNLGQVATVVAKQENVTRQKEEQRKSSTHTNVNINDLTVSQGVVTDYEFEVHKDLEFWYSWTLRFRVLPIQSQLAGGNLTIAPEIVVVNPNPLPDHTIPADPHGVVTLTHPTQTVQSHTHNIISGGAFTNIAPSLVNLRIYFDNVDFTPAFMAQFPGNWPDAGNLYQSSNWIPTSGAINDKFDIIEAAKVLGNWATLGDGGYHRMRIECDAGSAVVEFRMEMQYSHTNR